MANKLNLSNKSTTGTEINQSINTRLMEDEFRLITTAVAKAKVSCYGKK